MGFRQFNHLNVPEYWEKYFTKYPQGMTILESLFNWIDQVDKMVDNVNDWNTYLANFVKQFDTELQGTVTKTLTDWQKSGFLEVIIDEALQTQMDVLEDETLTKLAFFNNELLTKGSQAQLNTIAAQIATLIANAGNTDGNAELLDIRNGWDGVVYPTAGDSVRSIQQVMTEENQIWSVL